MSTTSTISIERLRAALLVAAEIAMMDKVYIPIFERMERELAAAMAQEDAIARARAAVAAHRATG